MTKNGVVNWWVSVNIVTDSNSETDFEVFCPTGATCCTDGGEIVNWLEKTATRNGNLQPEIETNEYSSSKKLLE